MICAACAHENRPGAKFCEECAAPLKRACASCGAELRPTAKFCDECAAPTGPGPRPTTPPRATAAEPADTRKVVTIVFADLVGSTALHERLDAESARRFMESYYAAMRGAVESQGGTVTQLLGDGVKAVFGIPRVAEDDAIRAVRAAVAMQEAFHALAEQQRGAVGATGLRVAVNTGEVVANDASEIIGDPVNVAARLQEQGRDGDVVVGESTHRLVVSLVTLELLGSFALKGRSEAVRAYRLVSLERPAGAATAPFVGRADELARLAAVYETALEKPAAALAVLVGSPGLGKSRLIDEFARRHADAATVVEAHCDAAGGSTFAPLAVALRELLGLEDGASAEAMRVAIEGALLAEDADRARIAGGIASLLSGSPASPEETFFVVRRLLGALARQGPVVLVIDDLHWAEPLLLDLVEHLIQWGSGVALFVLIGARPELRDLRSSLVTPGGLVADVITLAGLDAGAAMRLAANVIGAADLPAAIAAKVLATSEGNPLFVGELVRMLVQEGALTKEGDRWTVGANLAALEMPPTIQALLAARIERLRPEERTVLERAAVVGRHFSRSAVAALLPGPSTDLDARLEALRRSELIERDTGWLLGEPVLRFHHVLIRDAAYRRLLKGTRAELHARLADWIEAQVGDAADHDETIGWHLEQAHAFLRELGPLTEDGTRLGERAAARLAAAGRRALTRDDVALAASLLGRAIDRLDADDPVRADLALDWCEALLSAGDVCPASTAIEELGRFTETSDRLRAWQTCFASQLTVLTAPQGLQAAADAVAEAAQQLTALGDAAGEAKAHSVHAQALARLGKVGACEAALDLALAAARRAGDRRRANAVLAGAPLAALWGPSPVTRASGRCLDVVRVLRITQGAPAVESVALSCQGVLEALRGRTDAARRMLASSRKMVEELGIANRLFEADVFAGRIEAMEGDTAAAERLLRGAYDGLRDLGLGIDAARAGALLGRTLLAQDRVAEAEALSHESERLAGDDLQAAIAWRGVRAEALAKRGEHEAAVELAKAGVAIASATDALLYHADARMALAAALRAAGRGAEADAEERCAIDLWEAKGATLLEERARRVDAQAASIAAVPETRNARATTESDGRLARAEQFDADREADALAQFDALAATQAPAPARRRLRENASTRSGVRFEAALAARDGDAVAQLFDESLHVVHHPSGLTYGRREMLATWRGAMRAARLDFRQEILASLGDALALDRHVTAVEGLTESYLAGFGRTEVDEISLIEADDRGRWLRVELFAADRLEQAITRLYERSAELRSEGPDRDRATATAQVVATMIRGAGNDLDRVAAVLAPDFEGIDHRHLSLWSVRGAETYVEHLRAMRQVADDIAIRHSDILALRPDAMLTRIMHSGTARVGGGAYERPFLSILATDADGKLARLEWFDMEREAEALARFDALAGGGEAEPREHPFANAASRANRRRTDCFNTRDWTGVEACVSPDLVFDERRRLLRNTADRETWLAQTRLLFEVPESRFTIELLATRGERLSLHLHRFEGEVAGGGGPLALDDHLALHEVDREGRIVAIVLFDLEDRDAAYAELDARFVAGEASAYPHVIRSLRAGNLIYARDWQAFAAVHAPGFVYRDHRMLGWGTVRDTETYARVMQSLFELAPDARYRSDHVRILARGVLRQITLLGTREGGEFENPLVSIHEVDEQGWIAGADSYDVGDLDRALARFAELAAPAPAELPFANAATRTVERANAAFTARDWPAFAALFAPECRIDDRTAFAKIESDREQWLAAFRRIVELTSARPILQVLATRGDRFVLFRNLWQGAGDDVGPSELDWLLIVEVDGRGDHVLVVSFEPTALEAAYAELDARWETGEGTEHAAVVAFLRNFNAALARRDWDAVAEGYAPAFVGDDHRLVSWGTLRGPVAFVAAFQAMVALAPDVRLRWDHLRTASRGFIGESLWLGTRDGGAFESAFVLVAELDAHAKALRCDFYDPHHLDRARARFEEIRASERRDPRAAIAKPNAATVAMDRWQAAFESGDWDAMRALAAPGMKIDDRRRQALISYDADTAIADWRRVRAAGVRPGRHLLGTAGDRIAIERIFWTGGAPDARYEVEFVWVHEIDETGRFTASVAFDPDDARAAQREAWERWFAIDSGARQIAEPICALTDAFNEHDAAKFRAQLADDLVVEDHRLAGLGRIEGADAYVESVKVLWELAPDTRGEMGLRWPAFDRHGAITVLRRGGLLPDGGAFESVYLYLVLAARGRIHHVEMFELDMLEAALARFEALRRET